MSACREVVMSALTAAQRGRSTVHFACTTQGPPPATSGTPRALEPAGQLRHQHILIVFPS
ncbi:MAG: hypothetical protein QG597_2129 [Actinomycetota bacterium]|nr:hypothetical protein [Actinomycetota bacterium]